MYIFPGRIIQLARWTVTPHGHLLRDGKPVADIRYKAAKEQIQFVLEALNAAEEKR
jgi:hypothetical protein